MKKSKWWYDARDRNTPADVLSVLAVSPIVDIRCGVAWNPSTPSTVLEVLSFDTECDVRCGVACNPNTTPGVLEVLAADDGWDNPQGLQCGPLIEEGLWVIPRSRDCSVLLGVASNHNAPPTALTLLAESAHIEVRQRVAKNPNTPPLVKIWLQGGYGEMSLEEFLKAAR